jgi:hypothetical protein
MKLVDRVATIVWKSGAYALTTLLVVLGSAASATTLLSPAPAFNGRVVRLEHAPRPEDRHWLVATALVPLDRENGPVVVPIDGSRLASRRLECRPHGDEPLP